VIVQPLPPAPVAPPAPARAQRRKVVKAKPERSGAVKPARTKKTLPAPAARAADSSVDETLMIGGLALVVLVLGDTIFLAFSARLLRTS
jgi:hypothetical protein